MMKVRTNITHCQQAILRKRTCASSIRDTRYRIRYRYRARSPCTYVRSMRTSSIITGNFTRGHSIYLAYLELQMLPKPTSEHPKYQKNSGGGMPPHPPRSAAQRPVLPPAEPPFPESWIRHCSLPHNTHSLLPSLPLCLYTQLLI